MPQKVTLNTNLQAVAVKVTAHKTISLCSVYLPLRNHFSFNPKDLQDVESHKLLTYVQCSFRSRHSTVDHLVRFETFCREAFIHNQHLVSVFILFGENL